MMSADADVAVARRFYGAHGDRTVIDEVMSADVVWDITPGFPHGGVHTGLDVVLTEFLAPVAGLFASLGAQPEQFLADDAGHVLVLGHYAATGQDGRTANARFSHLWDVADGRLVHLTQTADTAELTPLIAPRG